MGAPSRRSRRSRPSQDQGGAEREPQQAADWLDLDATAIGRRLVASDRCRAYQATIDGKRRRSRIRGRGAASRPRTARCRQDGGAATARSGATLEQRTRARARVIGISAYGRARRGRGDSTGADRRADVAEKLRLRLRFAASAMRGELRRQPQTRLRLARSVRSPQAPPSPRRGDRDRLRPPARPTRISERRRRTRGGLAAGIRSARSCGPDASIGPEAPIAVGRRSTRSSSPSRCDQALGSAARRARLG